MTSKYDRVPSGIARYGIGEWDRTYGNHRAVLRVSQPAEAVYACLPWRRRDAFPQSKHVQVVDGQTGKTVQNSVVTSCNREYGEVVFEPVSGPGVYYAYYLVPAQDRHRWEWPRWAFPVSQYASPRTTADPGWRARHGLQQENLDSPPNPAGTYQSPDPYPAAWRDLPEAELIEFQSRGQRHSFFPMEVIATLEETQELISRCGERPFLLFPESRHHPIRMDRDIPYHWAVRNPVDLDCFQATARRNEYLVFQVGVFAHRELLANVTATWTALQGPAGACIPASAMTCFNLGGIDQRGHRFVKTLHLPRQKLQALWFGIDIPRDAIPGRYDGTLTITAQGLTAQTVRLQIDVEEGILEDRGDGDGAYQSRLRWLNSTHALDDEACAPFTPVEVKGRLVTILGRSLYFGEDCLPEKLTSFIDMFTIRDRGREILAAPLRMDVLKDGRPIAWLTDRPARCWQKSSGKASFRACQEATGLRRQVETTIEMDGRIGVRISLQVDQDAALDTAHPVVLEAVRLVIQLPADVCRYWLEPPPLTWKWGEPVKLGSTCPECEDRPLSAFQSAWVGDYNAGLACSIMGKAGGWLSGSGGRFRQKRSDATCTIELDTGALQLTAGETLNLEFVLYVTPFKPLPREHWDWRYYHQSYGLDLDLEQGIAAGARVLTQHQGSPSNPFISYLFPVAETLKRYADQVHQAGGLFKAYNTIRELSTRADELWTLRSLGEEVLAPSIANLGYESLAQLPLEYQLRNLVDEPFTGQLWMCEHLVDNYHARWHSPVSWPDGSLVTEDSSLQISGASRWSNFYIESLRWLMEHAGVDGLYLDGVTFDRASFLRVRKTLVRQKPQALIDFHGSPAEVLDFLGFIDSIWFGEGADYGREDAYWLTAVSGIPFGIPGELLLPEASVQRGMLYGLSQRYAWMPLDQVNPAPLWKWWDQFDIRSAEMLGYWMSNCPARTDHSLVKATVYLHLGRRAAIALASWAVQAVNVKLKIDWQAIGLSPASARVTIPEIDMFQPVLEPVSLDSLQIEPGQGWIIVVEAQ